MKYLWTSTKITLTALLTITTVVVVTAQKLPNIQQESLHAPVDVKIDGKNTEWGGAFKADNKATGILYTVANDAENLYLVLQTKDVDALIKITTVGIRLIINTEGKKSDKDAISIRYPFFDGINKPYISFRKLPPIAPDATTTSPAVDSVMKSWNRKLDDKSKDIKILGMKGIDTVISVYNDNGIKVAEAFDNKLAYNYELAIPLKYLNLSAGQVPKLAYHIILPAINIGSEFGIKSAMVNGVMTISAAPGVGNSIPSKEHFNAVSANTDFWGEYTLLR